MSTKLPYLKGRSITAQTSLFAALFLSEMAARKCSATDRVPIPDSDSENDFGLDSNSHIDFLDYSSNSDESNHDSMN